MEHCQCVDVDPRFIIAIERMEMRRIVVIVEHADDDAEKAANLRHRQGFL